MGHSRLWNINSFYLLLGFSLIPGVWDKQLLLINIPVGIDWKGF